MHCFCLYFFTQTFVAFPFLIQTGPDGAPGRNVPAAVEQKDAQESVKETYAGERQMGVYKQKRRGVSTKNAQVCKNVISRALLNSNV